MKIKRAFTLIEVLVAGSVLFIVSAAVVGLSNSIIQGTAITTDEASANRLATEGLELISKIRDDTVKNGSFNSVGSEGKFIWFAPVENPAEYGWYQLSEGIIPNQWSLANDNSDFPDNTIDFEDPDFDTSKLETISGGQIDYYRLICIEAIGAENDLLDDSTNCNSADNGNLTVIDGDRQTAAAANGECYSGGVSGQELREDIYCKITKPSLNRNRIVPNKLIPDGNAIKVRSIVLWQDKDKYRRTEVTTILTNWQTLTQ